MGISRVSQAVKALQADVKAVQANHQASDLYSADDAVQSIEVGKNGRDEFVNVTLAPLPPGEDANDWAKVALRNLGFEGVDVRVTVLDAVPSAPHVARAEVVPEWLKSLPLDWTDANLQAFWKNLSEAFATQTVDERVESLRTVGLSPAELKLDSDASTFWMDVLSQASLKGVTGEVLKLFNNWAALNPISSVNE